ncbi:GrpB family protein [Mucilaginibacter sp.]|uniref:GrpB family protein n=1 Tax=Mucilaginibacter sp. TaxID=1882438 RepID=UPI00283D370F|nr:GrpB family protein [Mucilaginibacter sp.]MDR3695304.1 GrpB family protein [Mucilaginibacter sp.]
MDTIKVAAYDPQWPEQFKALKSVYLDALASQTIKIEHIGSTAVPGLAAKPILDIDIVVADEIQLDKVIPAITLLGYQFMGDLGIKDRYAFKPVSELSPDDHSGTIWPKHNLYCCIEGSVSLANHLLFRNALRTDPALAQQYGELKKSLAFTATDIDVYIEGKSAFIARVLQQAGIQPEHVADIVNQNKKK